MLVNHICSVVTNPLPFDLVNSFGGELMRIILSETRITHEKSFDTISTGYVEVRQTVLSAELVILKELTDIKRRRIV